MLHLLFHLNNEMRTFSVPWPDMNGAGAVEIPYRVRECAAFIVETTSERFPIPIKDRTGLFSYTSQTTMADVEEWLADIGMMVRKGSHRDRLQKLLAEAPPGEITKIPADVVAWVQAQARVDSAIETKSRES